MIKVTASDRVGGSGSVSAQGELRRIWQGFQPPLRTQLFLEAGRLKGRDENSRSRELAIFNSAATNL